MNIHEKIKYGKTRSKTDRFQKAEDNRAESFQCRANNSKSIIATKWKFRTDHLRAAPAHESRGKTRKVFHGEFSAGLTRVSARFVECTHLFVSRIKISFDNGTTRSRATGFSRLFSTDVHVLFFLRFFIFPVFPALPEGFTPERAFSAVRGKQKASSVAMYLAFNVAWISTSDTRLIYTAEALR